MIRSESDIRREVSALASLDPSLVPMIAIAGPPPLRPSPPGLRGLVAIIVGQQVSRASAEAIFARLARLVDLDDPAALFAAGDETLRAAGLSRPKMLTLRAIAAACLDGRLDFARIADAEPRAALAELVALHGVGPWTAGCHLLFSCGHPDVFPSGDVALQAAVAHALGLSKRPTEKALAILAERWRPHRSIAARLFWAYYAAMARRGAAPVVPDPAEVGRAP